MLIEVASGWARGRVIAGTLASVLVALTAVAGPALADAYDPQRRDAEARAAQAASAATSIASTIGGLDARLAQAAADLRATQARLPVAQAELATAERTAERLHREAIAVAARVQDAQTVQAGLTTTIAGDDARAAQAHLAVGQIARAAYRGETAATALAVVTDAASAQDFVDQYALVATALRAQTADLNDLLRVAATDRDAQARERAVTAKITELKAAADVLVAQADAATADAAVRQAEIARLISDQTTKQSAIAALKAQAEADQATIDAQRAVIATELAGIIARQRAAAARIPPSAAGQAVTCTAGAAGTPGAGLPTSVGVYSGEQLINAAQIIIAGNDLGVDLHGQVIAVMTAIGESGLLNIDHGDAAGPDSRGLFQQRANGAWGSYADRMDPRTAATSFFRALLQVPGWEAMPPTLAAHLVQGNADPYYYAPSWSAAVQIVAALGGHPFLSCR